MRESHQLNCTNEDLHQQSDRNPSPCPSLPQQLPQQGAAELTGTPETCGVQGEAPKKQKIPDQSTLHLPAPALAEVLPPWALKFLKSEKSCSGVKDDNPKGHRTRVTRGKFAKVSPVPLVCVLLFPN